MTDKILRTPTRAEGGVTEAEKLAFAKITKKYIDNALRTDTIDPDKCRDAIERLYTTAGLEKPIVVIVPSPYVMALAYGLSAGIWYLRSKNELSISKATHAATRDATRDATDAATHAATDAATDDATYDATHAATRDATDDATDDATYAATRAATDDATYAATRAATRDATRDATYAATRAATDDATYAATDAATDAATYDATHAATYAATDDATYAATRAATDDATYAATRAATDDANYLLSLATQFTEGDENKAKFLLSCINRWSNNYQGGNMWGYWLACAEAMRDVLGLTGLDCWSKYQAWEDAGTTGGFRVMHEKFCIVSDFPEILVQENGIPHCDSGPSHRWRDGFEIYHLRGVRFERDLWQKIVDKTLTLDELGKIQNADQRAVANQMLDPTILISKEDGKLIHTGIKGTRLYEIPNYMGEYGKQYCMIMEHPSIEGKLYLEWVAPDVGKLGNADLAQCHAWKDSDGDPIPLEDYLNAVEA